MHIFLKYPSAFVKFSLSLNRKKNPKYRVIYCGSNYIHIKKTVKHRDSHFQLTLWMEHHHFKPGATAGDTSFRKSH